MLAKLSLFALVSAGLFADIVNISPPSIDFGNQVVGTQSWQFVRLINPTKKVLNIASITVTGDFTLPQAGCGATLAPETQCIFAVVFAPTVAGSRDGVLIVSDDAMDSTQKAKLSGVGVPVTLVSIAVAPPMPAVPLGLTVQFSAAGTYNNGNIQDLTTIATWNSTTASVSIVNAAGLASTLAQGTTGITATVGTVSGSATLQVAPPVLVSMSLSPASATVKKRASLQLVATGVYSDGGTADLTATSQWASLSPSIVSVTSSGLTSALAPGTATIRASSGNLSATSAISVAQPVVVSTAILPTSFFIPMGTFQQFTCKATYDDGTTSDVTSSLLSWGSSAPTTCSIDSSGLAFCRVLGTVTIEANLCAPAVAQLVCAVTEPRNNMSSRRYLHTATVLSDGRVLVAGGFGSSATVATADLYDPSTRTFSPTGSMASDRSRHTATLLPNGQVLITGGTSSSSQFELSSAELYDPATGLFSPTGSLNSERQGHTATLLPNGKVLIAGGDALTAELYDPAAGTFTQVGSMSVLRFEGTGTLLNNGKVLFTGGTGSTYAASAELFDSSTGTFSPTGSMNVPRAYHSAVLLNNGSVFITGGYNGTVSLTSTEIYDPTTEIFTLAGPMSTARDTHRAVVLPSGKVLVSGGENQTGLLTDGEIFDPASSSFVMPGILNTAHYPGPGFGHTASLLSNGQVLITGGVAPFSFGGVLSSAEIFVPQQ